MQDIIIGCIFKILVLESLHLVDGVVTIEIFNVENELHLDFDMPVLCKDNRYCTVTSKVHQ